MQVRTYEATVEHGKVKLPETVKLPEHARVYVVVPGIKEQAADFAMEIVEGEDAVLR